MKTIPKKLLAVLLCLLLLGALAGCGAKKTGAVFLFAMIDRLYATQTELGLPQTDTPIDALEGGTVDPALVGAWKTADGTYTYTYTEDGAATVTMNDQNATASVPFTCLVRQGHNILCEALQAPDAEEGQTQLSYTAYLIEGDAMYALSVEALEAYATSYQAALQCFYRADETGSIDAALAAHPVDLASFAGTWNGDKGSFTVDGNTLTLNGETAFNVSLNEKHQLIVEKDGVSTAYNFGVALTKNTVDVENTQWERHASLSLYYTGADENDKPNLLPVLSDWAAEFDWPSNYFSASFTEQEASDS